MKEVIKENAYSGSAKSDIYGPKTNDDGKIQAANESV